MVGALVPPQPILPGMTRAERATILLLLALAVVGQGVRLAFHGATGPPDPQAPAGTHATRLIAQRNAAAAAERPLEPGERIDPNTSSANDLARIPGVGMRLAKRIVEDRDLRGPFDSIADLDRVDGVGPGMLRRLEPFLHLTVTSPPGDRLVDLNQASLEELQWLPGIGPAKAAAIVAWRERLGPFSEAGELDRVPGIGPALALRLAPLVRVW